MSIAVHYGVAADGSIGPPALYELAKKSGGDHKESLRSIDSKRRNEKVIQACTQHLLENSASPTHFVAKQWKENENFRMALEDAGGHEVGPDDAQNYVRAEHLSRMKKSKPKRDSIAKPAVASTSNATSKLLDPEIASAIKAYQSALPQQTKAKPPPGDVTARRTLVGMSLQYFTSILPNPHTDPNTGAPTPGAPMVRDLFAISSHDGIYIPLRWHTPTQPVPHVTPGAAMLYIHGGAMIASSASQYNPFVANLVARSGVPALAVEYRFAPEYTPLNNTPGAIEDVFDALMYLRAHATDLGIDPSRIAIVGDGGGGAIAAALCHHAVRLGGPQIAKQLLFAPMLDDRTKTAAPKLPPSLLLWNASDEETAWRAVLGPRKGVESPTTTTTTTNNNQTHPPHLAAVQQAPQAHMNGPHSQTIAEPPGPDLVPARAPDIPRAMPALYIDVGEHDIVRDECVAYACKFWRAGVNAEMHVWPGVGSWFDMVAPRAGVSVRAGEARVQALMGV